MENRPAATMLSSVNKQANYPVVASFDAKPIFSQTFGMAESQNALNRDRLAMLKEMIEANEKHLRENAKTLRKMRAVVREIEKRDQKARGG